MIRVKRAYEPASADDGRRFLVDALWPRGLSRQSLALEAWLRQVAPSSALRRWYGHDPARWPEFKARYFAELERKPAAWQPLLHAAQTGTVTLVYASRERERNNAVALKEYLEGKLATPSSDR